MSVVLRNLVYRHLAKKPTALIAGLEFHDAKNLPVRITSSPWDMREWPCRRATPAPLRGSTINKIVVYRPIHSPRPYCAHADLGYLACVWRLLPTPCHMRLLAPELSRKPGSLATIHRVSSSASVRQTGLATNGASDQRGHPECRDGQGRPPGGGSGPTVASSKRQYTPHHWHKKQHS